MKTIKNNNFTKKNISQKIHSKIGFSNTYINKVTEDLIEIIKNNIKKKELNIKNFGTFKIINKKERIGRNPKSGKVYLINARKSLSFTTSKNLKKKINLL